MSLVCTWTFSLVFVRLLRIVRRRRESVVFTRRILITFGLSDLPRAHHLRVTTDSRCLARVNVRQQQYPKKVK